MEWDPLNDDAAEGPVFLETVDVEGAAAPIVKDDVERAQRMVYKKVVAAEPWQKPPESKPDLSWHKATCTLEKWGHKDVKVSMSEGITYVTLNRPDAGNRLNAPMVEALCDAIFLLHGRAGDVRVGVFTGEGKIFCSGGDGTGFAGKAPADPQVREALATIESKAVQGGAFTGGKVAMARLLQAKLWHTWITLPQFTVCLCNGSAMGDGLGCVTVCDMAIAVKTAYFVVSEVKLGLIPANLSPYIVAKVGSSNSKRMFCLSENLSAEKAREVNLINEIVDSVAEGHKMVADICKRLTECGPKTVTFAKEVIHSVAGQAMSEPLMFYASAKMTDSAASEEAKAAARCGQSAKKPWEETPIKPLF